MMGLELVWSLGGLGWRVGVGLKWGMGVVVVGGVGVWQGWGWRGILEGGVGGRGEEAMGGWRCGWGVEGGG